MSRAYSLVTVDKISALQHTITNRKSVGQRQATEISNRSGKPNKNTEMRAQKQQNSSLGKRAPVNL